MINVLVVCLLALYPILMWLALQQASARSIATAIVAFLLAAIVVNFLRTHQLLPLLLRRFGVLVAFALAAFAFDSPLALKLLPVVTQIWLLATFGITLVRGPTLAEHFVRAAHHGELPDFLLPYVRAVTMVWCGFFAFNAVLYTYLALRASTGSWALYTGFGAYLVAAVLIAGEYVFHKAYFRFYEDGWTDRIWRRLLPPERSRNGRRSLAYQASRQTLQHPGA
ncbi:MAG TPA: hypothetical protein VEL28_04540 [Candidatus Binatia bacterium]|nr:hypothetical protein [Candidatus Binatia bacterium]